MIHANLRKGLFAVAIVAGLGMLPFAQAVAHDDHQAMAGMVDDASITAQVQSTLVANKAVKGSDISVNTTAGVVTLRGTVATAKEKSRAESLAMKVKGVKNVDASELVVSTDNKSAAVQ